MIIIIRLNDFKVFDTSFGKKYYNFKTEKGIYKKKITIMDRLWI